MVRRRLGSRAGRARPGCLLLVLVAVAVAYFAADNANIYLEYVQMLHEMRVQAHFAVRQTDETIQKKLVAKAEELGLPDEARHFTIQRTVNPSEIIISTTWEETLELPYYRYRITLHPVVREQL